MTIGWCAGRRRTRRVRLTVLAGREKGRNGQGDATNRFWAAPDAPDALTRELFIYPWRGQRGKYSDVNGFSTRARGQPYDVTAG